MIQALRRKFIATNMLLVSIVLIAVFSIQAFSVYSQTRIQIRQAQELALRVLLREDPFEFEFGPHHPGRDRKPEDGFPTVPVFSVEIGEDGQLISVREGPGSTVTWETAQELVDKALSRSKEQGRLSGSTLSYLYREENGRYFLAFSDVSVVSSSLRTQLFISILICLLALAVFYVISRFLARLSLQPTEKAWKQQRQFVADASHELKTPLTVILANTGILLEHRSDMAAEQTKWISYIQEEAQRMKALVDDLLFLAKNDSAAPSAHLALVRLSELVTGSLLPFESVAFESGVTLSESVSPGITILGDADQLRRLIIILIDNAVKYAGKSGSVTVHLELRQDMPYLTVHNTGVPIPPQHLPHLFDRFYRADPARNRSQGGYGLGLAIAKSIIESHAGAISVSSSQEAGTLFTVSFPKKSNTKMDAET